MPNLYVITGPAGVGKSTVSRRLATIKEKSVLIEGDEIYNQVIGGYVSAWKEGNHLDVFWKVCLDMINTYLENGYDVVFNYIVTPDVLKKIKERFSRFKFVILITDEDELLKRDLLRPEDCRMRERCVVLLNNFKNNNYDKDYMLDITKLSVDEVIEHLENDDKFNA